MKENICDHFFLDFETIMFVVQGSSCHVWAFIGNMSDTRSFFGQNGIK